MDETKRLHALLVEDDPGERWIMSEILRSRGHAVTQCETAEVAWERYQAEPCALALLDWILPGMDGLELCRRIRRHPLGDRTVVLVVTGRDEPEDLEEVLRAGADDYMSKPIDVGLMNVRLAVAEKESEEIAIRSEAQRRHRLLVRRLKKANEELEAFAYTVSHDLRTPLRTMEGFAHTLLADFGDQLPEQARDYARRIVASGRRSERLIGDLLEYSRLSFEEVELEPVELEHVMKAALERVSADIEETGAEIRVERPLPHVRGHASTLVRVVDNLLSNALKFVPDGASPAVRVRAEERGDRVRLWVEDRGIGISPEQHERVFGIFERLVESGDRPGTGIGLAIVRRGMERIGGSAGVDSDGRSGARFWIEIPGPRTRAEGEQEPLPFTGF